MTARTILIVDDDTDLRAILVEQLSLYEEFQIIEEDNATKGVQSARNGVVDLLIMDVGLPDMDGRGSSKAPAQGWFQSSRHHADRT
jgi:DNA-binding response OmpR family regulator